MRCFRGSFRLLAALLFLTLAADAQAQPPLAASAGVASGDVAGSRPTFSWGAVPGSTWYYLWVRDSTGADKLTQWYTAETLGCANGPVCSVTLDLTMSPGLAEWWVQTWNASGFGPWSATRTVRVSSLQTGGTSAFFGSYPPASATGVNNTGVGAGVLAALTSGGGNIAVGYRALSEVTTGGDNVAVGVDALKKNVSGNLNVGIGLYALFSNVAGLSNTAVGAHALRFSTQDGNVALGTLAGGNLTGGSSNLFIGSSAGSNITGSANFNIMIGNNGIAGDNNAIRIGNINIHNAAYLAGVYASTVSSRVVYVDSNGRLGTLSSSRATKRNIRPLGDASARLFDLRPVAFQYRSSPAGSRDVEYGLIAEEVAKTFPELVDRGMSGKPETVRYHLLTPLLLNELQKARADVDTLMTELREMKARVAALEQQRPPK